MTTVNTDELREMLRMGKVHFEFTKRDGSIREVLGTLNSDYIPENMRPIDSSTRKITTIRFFDMEKNEWRSISGDTKEVTVL